MAYSGHQGGFPQQPFQPTGSSQFSGFGGASGRSDQPKFDILVWFPQYQSCLRYFLDHAQHSYPCQALAAFINIKLPCQRQTDLAVTSSQSPGTTSPQAGLPPGGLAPHPRQGAMSPVHRSQSNWISLIPYLRRLVASGFDAPGILHGWFGDDWAAGVGPLHEQERRNFLFAAKSGGWAAVKRDYDMDSDQAIPFIRPLERLVEGEIEAAETSWSEWLAMEDWMIGPRAIDPMQTSHGKAKPSR